MPWGCHRSKISGSQQSFKTDFHLHCQMMEEKYKLTFWSWVKSCTGKSRMHSSIFSLPSAILAGPLFVEIQKFCYQGNVTLFKGKRDDWRWACLYLARLWPCAIKVRNVRNSTWSMMYMQVAGDTHSLAWILHWMKNTGLRELWRPRIYAADIKFLG